MSKIRVRGVVEYQGKYLMVRIKLANTYWCLPGGGVNEGEDVLAALHREMVEETGVAPEIGNLLFVQQMETLEGYTRPEFFFHVKNGQDYLHIDLAKTSHGAIELEEIGFKDLAGIKLLPGFLVTELPEVTKENFSGPARYRLTTIEA